MGPNVYAPDMPFVHIFSALTLALISPEGTALVVSLWPSIR